MKVQIPVQCFGETNPETGRILVQNKDRSYMAFIGKENNPIIYNDLTTEIKRNGVQGLKGYFIATLDSGTATHSLVMYRSKSGSLGGLEAIV